MFGRTPRTSGSTNKPLADECTNAEKILKHLMPEDAKKALGHGVQITRDRVDRLSLRPSK